MTGVAQYSTTPANNITANTGVNWDEGMSPSAVNNSARQNMTDLRLYANNPEWFLYGGGTSPVVVPAYASSTSFTVAGLDVTATYHVGRRVKAVGSGTGTIYGTISATAFSTNTTVTVGWDSGSLTNETLAISIGPAIANFPVSSQRLSTRQALISGSGATYTTPAGVRQLRIRMVGAGGGGGGGGSAGGNAGFSSFDNAGTNYKAIGGTGGQQSNTATFGGGAGGTGGTGGTSPNTFRTPGQGGGGGQTAGSGGQAFGYGAMGGSSQLGGATAPTTNAGQAAAANTGAGGNGGSTGSTVSGGGGGGAGEYVEIIINSPSATYTYTIGAGGTAGTAGGGVTGGAGGSGLILVDELY